MIGGAGLLGGPTHGSPPSAGTRSPPGLAAPAGRREPAFRDEDRAWKRSGDERRRAACPSRRLYVNARSAGRFPRLATLPKGNAPDATDRLPPPAPAPNGKMPPRPLRREISARPLWNGTLSSAHNRAADLCGRESRPSRASARACPKKGDPHFQRDVCPLMQGHASESAQTWNLGRPIPAKARRRLSATTYFHRSCVCAPLLLFWMGKPGPSAWREKSGCQRNGFC